MNILSRPEFKPAIEWFINSVKSAQEHDKIAAAALEKYGDHGATISGIVREHFPDNIKKRLRTLASQVTEYSNNAWKTRPRGVRKSTMRKLSQAVAQKYGHGFYGPRPNPTKRKAKKRRPKLGARKGNPVHNFQIATYRDGHAWFWDGGKWTSNRSFAALYRSVPIAKYVAQRCNAKCAVVTSREAIPNIERFFTGKH
jgi:hypothetical protein